MTLIELVHRVSVEPVSQSDLEQVAKDFGLSLSTLCGAIAREVGAGYLLGKYPWEFGDAAMNNMFAAAYANHNIGLSDFVLREFEAFDEGEYQSY